MSVFLDAEWADNDTLELVSLGLVSQDGRHRFYAERHPLPAAPSPFVASDVYPLLVRTPTRLSSLTNPT